MNNTILNYLEGYFDGQLNESTSDEDIMEAFAELLETANAVEEYMNEQGPISKALSGMRNKKDLKKALKQRAHRKAVGSIGSGHPWNADTPNLELSRRSLKRRGLQTNRGVGPVVSVGDALNRIDASGILSSEPKRAGLPTYMKKRLSNLGAVLDTHPMHGRMNKDKDKSK